MSRLSTASIFFICVVNASMNSMNLNDVTPTYEHSCDKYASLTSPLPSLNLGLHIASEVPSGVRNC
eukprot:3401055-Amphidinium_carterae.1